MSVSACCAAESLSSVSEQLPSLDPFCANVKRGKLTCRALWCKSLAAVGCCVTHALSRDVRVAPVRLELESALEPGCVALEGIAADLSEFSCTLGHPCTRL